MNNAQVRQLVAGLGLVAGATAIGLGEVAESINPIHGDDATVPGSVILVGAVIVLVREVYLAYKRP